MFRNVYYYQTFVGLKPVLENSNAVSVLNVSSIHFGKDDSGKPYIHLNDLPPDDSTFDKLWEQTKQASDKGITIVLMVGGAAGAYHALFSEFDTYYQLLKSTITDHDWITGIDLDIEEQVEISQVEMLIKAIRSDFGKDFTITMAPLLGSLLKDMPGLGGFVYKNLYKSSVGKEISWFNVQSYHSYTVEDFTAMVDNGYPPDKLVFGMLQSQFRSSTFGEAVATVKSLRKKYPSMAGVFVWEYYKAPPGGTSNPVKWAQLMYSTKPQSSANKCNML